jgi:hypothetical protein
MVASTFGGLAHAERRGRLVEDQHLGAEMHRAGDRHGLALTARQRADRLVGTAQIDAHLAHLLHGDAVGVVMVEA